MAKMKLRWIHAVALPVVAALVACSAAPSDSSDDTSAASTGTSGLGHAHVMKMHNGKQTTMSPANEETPAATSAKLVYYGGPVISSPQVYAVYWGSGVQYTSHIESFYTTILKSPYMDWLTEYNTPTQTIGEGTFKGSVTASGVTTSGSITDADIQTELQKLIDAGTLPQNDGNTYYAFYFPPGLSITMSDGSASCVQFCAYHSTMNAKNGKYAFYGVMPDLGGGCASGCGSLAQQDNVTVVSSHELIEATTDAAVGLATSYASPLAWYDQTNGEIGDICNAESATVSGFAVQKVWSNQSNACIATKAGSTDGGGTDSGGNDGGTTDGGKDGGGTDGGGGTCAHSDCSTGTKLTASCDPCVQKVCASDSYCCNTSWDSTCVGEVGSICGQSCTGGGDGGTTDGGKDGGGTDGGGSCTHNECTSGSKLKSGCDSCVTKICAQDSYCCNTTWDSVCVSEAGSICGETCK